MKVLITGACGLLGSRMADWIKTHKPQVEVIGLDDLSGGWRENLREDVPFYQMNLLHTVNSIIKIIL
ncbi:NAD-dependent epimerase/dehydratase family protein [bacterium]|nr:NAD-dependent epimerase/dehydratase family protein [Candidatus Elulimicrobium humile]